jgi:predicted Zn-dependent protease
MGSEHAEIANGERAYRELLKATSPSRHTELQGIVTRVGGRLAAISGRPDYKWEFRLVESSAVNAFCLPGGKVVVNEGILPVCRTEAGLAAIVAHEIGHALARHGRERQVQAGIADFGRVLVNEYTKDRSLSSQLVLGLGYRGMAKYGVLLPYSRAHESEADRIGVFLMAEAGFDPMAAVELWTRMKTTNTGASTAEFASTHPSHEKRIMNLMALMPEARRVYQQSLGQVGRGMVLPLGTAQLAGERHSPRMQADLHYNSGLREAAEGRHANAIKEFTAALALVPQDHEARFNRGNAYYRTGDLASAIGDYRAVVELIPEYAPAQQNLRITLNRQDASSSGGGYLENKPAAVLLPARR